MILQTKIAISVFFLSLSSDIVHHKGLVTYDFSSFIVCLLAFGRNTQIISPMAHTMSSICFEVELKFSNSGSYKQYQRGGIQRNHSPLFTTQYTTQLRIWTKPLISHNALILQYFIPCFFVIFFFKYNNLFHCLKLFAKTNLSTAVGITLHCKIRSHLTIYIGSRVHFEWRATEWGEYLRIN